MSPGGPVIPGRPGIPPAPGLPLIPLQLHFSGMLHPEHGPYKNYNQKFNFKVMTLKVDSNPDLVPKLSQNTLILGKGHKGRCCVTQFGN